MAMDADPATAQIFRPRDGGIAAHHDAAMVEATVRKNRNRTDRRAATFEPEVLGDLQLADVELPVAHEAPVALARGQRDELQVKARRGNLSIDQRASAVVIAAGESQGNVGHRSKASRAVENFFCSWEKRGSFPACKPRLGRCQAVRAVDKPVPPKRAPIIRRSRVRGCSRDHVSKAAPTESGFPERGGKTPGAVHSQR